MSLGFNSAATPASIVSRTTKREVRVKMVKIIRIVAIRINEPDFVVSWVRKTND